jgi:tetratricopeptide (TPR) repeat protein
MRIIQLIRTLTISLSIVVAHAFVTPLSAVGWDWNPFGASETSKPPAAKSLAKREGSITSTVPRWTDGAVKQANVQGASPNGVQQTAHTGPARGGTLLGGSTPPKEKSTPTWRGQTVRMPTKMFARGATAAVTRPATNTVAKDFPGATTAARTRPGATAAVRGTPVPATSHASATRQRPTTATHSKAEPSTDNAHGPTLARTDEPTLEETRPTQSINALPAGNKPTQTADASVQPKTPGDRLILEAHEFSGRATTEQDFSRVIETCRRARASKLSPELNNFANELAAWSLNRRGQLKAEAGNVNEALLDFDDALRANPKLWRALHNRGVLRAQACQFESSFDDFNLTIQLNPKFAKAYSNRAALFVVAGDLEAALEDYTQATELDPDLAVAHRGRGRLCHQFGRLDEALDHFDAAVQLAPDDAYAVMCRADLLTDLGRYVEAADGYEQAIKLDPNSAAPLLGSAWLLATCPEQSVRNGKLAVQRAEQAIALGGKRDALGLDTLAAAQACAGDFAAALQAIRQAIQLAPEQERAVYQDRLQLYQRARPYRIAPVRSVAQASYDAVITR